MRRLYNEYLIREAVDIVIGDDGLRSAEVLGVVRMLQEQQAASNKRQAATCTNNKININTDHE